MSSPGTPTPTKRPRTLARMPTPCDEAEVYRAGWLIHENTENQQTPVPVGPPVPVAGFQALQITSSTKWFRKIAFGHAAHDVHGKGATLILIDILIKRAKAAFRAQPSSQTLIAASLQASGPIRGASMLDTSSESDHDRGNARAPLPDSCEKLLRIRWLRSISRSTT